MGAPRLPQGWLAAVPCALVLGLVASRAASHKSTGSVLLLMAACAPFLLMLVRDVRRTLIVLVVLDTAFQWDKNFGYNATAANMGSLGGLNVSVTTIALAGLYLMWFAERAAARTKVNRRLLTASLPLITYLTFTALSVTVAGNKTLAVDEMAMLVQTFLLFIYIAGSIRTSDDVRFVAAAIVTCLFVESLLTLLLPFVGHQKLLGISTYAQAQQVGNGTDSRFGGTIGAPNTAAAFFSLLIAPAVVLATAPVSRRVRRVSVLAVLLATLALILTLSRGGWLAFIVSFAFLSIAGVKRGWLSPKVPVIFVVVLTIIVLPFAGTLAQRITGNDYNSAAGRLPLIRLAETVIKNHPVLGIGVNNLGLVFPHYAGPQYSGDWIYTVHNKYLLVWAESGIGALIGFVWFLLSTVRRGWRLWHGHDPLLAPLALGLTAGIIGQMVHMSVDIFQSRPQVQLLWLVAGLLVAMERVAWSEGRNVASTEAASAARPPTQVAAVA